MRVMLVTFAIVLIISWSIAPLLCLFILVPKNPDTNSQATAGKLTGFQWLLSQEASQVRIATRNSIIIATLAASLVVACGLPAGYALGVHLHARTSVLSGLVLGRALPACAIIMPILGFCLSLKINGSLLVLAVLHSMITLPFMVALIARQPWDKFHLIEQTALLDGGRPFNVRLQLWIVVVLPTLTFGFIMAWLYSWNEFGFAVMLMSGDSTTLPVVLNGFETIRGVEWSMLTTTLFVAILPPLSIVLAVAAVVRRIWKTRGLRGM